MSGDGVLGAYCRAFESKDADAIISLFDANALYELPLLGQRLVGRAEIKAGLQRAFSVAETCCIELTSVRSSPMVTMAEGRLSAKLHRDREAVDMPLAIVLQTRDGRVARLSTYLDARPYRLWTDGPIFATAGQAS